MLRLAPDFLVEGGTAAEWFKEHHGSMTLSTELSNLLNNYCIQDQYNNLAGRMVLEAMILGALLSHPENQLHKNLGVTIKGGVCGRDPHCLSIVQVEITDMIGGQKLSSLSFTYNESTEWWDGFDLMEVV